MILRVFCFFTSIHRRLATRQIQFEMGPGLLEDNPPPRPLRCLNRSPKANRISAVAQRHEAIDVSIPLLIAEYGLGRDRRRARGGRRMTRAEFCAVQHG